MAIVDRPGMRYCPNCKAPHSADGFVKVPGKQPREHCAKCEQRRVIAMAAIRARKRTVTTCS